MINEYICYKCYCDKCNHSWVIMPEIFPKMCPKCKTKKWNDKSLGSAQVHTEIVEETVDETPDEHGEVPMTTAEKVRNLRDLIAPIEAGVVAKVIPIEEEWKFNPKEKPQFHDDGNVYRQQYLAPQYKVSRTVQVEEGAFDQITRIIR